MITSNVGVMLTILPLGVTLYMEAYIKCWMDVVLTWDNKLFAGNPWLVVGLCATTQAG